MTTTTLCDHDVPDCPWGCHDTPELLCDPPLWSPEGRRWMLAAFAAGALLAAAYWVGLHR